MLAQSSLGRTLASRLRIPQIVTTIKLATWNERKRLHNLRVHRLDFDGCEAIWDDFTVTRENIRRRYNEQRLVVFGRLDGQIVVLVYTERPKGPHMVSLRKAEKYEARYYIAEARKS